jgi:hypothetical protein
VTTADDLECAFARFGRSMRWADGFTVECPWLEDWLAEREPLFYALPLVVMVEDGSGPRRWLAVKGAWLCDGAATLGRWARIEDMPQGRWAVRAVWAVERR